MLRKAALKGVLVVVPLALTKNPVEVASITKELIFLSCAAVAELIS